MRAATLITPVRAVACSLAAALLGLAVSSAEGAWAADVQAPSVVAPGEQVTIVGGGFLPGTKVSVVLSPALNRGGNCCGIRVVQDRPVESDGTVTASFAWPATYQRCGGVNHCSSTPWQRDETVDLFVAGTAPGRSQLASASLLIEQPGAGGDLTLEHRFRPLLAFDSSEPWRPLHVPRMFLDDEPGVCGRGGCYPSASMTALDFVRRLDMPGRQDDAGSYRSARAECRRDGLADCDRGPGAGIYVHSVEHEGYRYLDYWWYLRFNHAPFTRVYYGEHEGDWEGATIAVPAADPERFDFAAIAAHEGVWRYLRDALVCEDPATRAPAACSGAARLKVFVADGTHAGYPQPCRKLAFLYCRQTGMPLPEKGFDGRRPWGANYDTAALHDLERPWVTWPGNWNSDAERQVHSPGRQGRFTRPWDVTCTGRFSAGNQLNCVLAGAAQAREAADCATWSGPFVAATACDPAVLRQALRDGTLGQPGAVALELDGAVEATAPGLAQAVAEPLRPGQTLTVTGAQPDTELRVRAGDADEVLDAVYQGLPSSGQVQVTAGVRGGQPTLTARAADGRRLAPTDARRLSARPPARPRGLVARRRGARVRVSFRATTARAAIELRGRGGRLLSSRLIRVRRARVVQTASLTGGRRARSVRVVAVSATGRPSRAASARVR